MVRAFALAVNQVIPGRSEFPVGGSQSENFLTSTPYRSLDRRDRDVKAERINIEQFHLASVLEQLNQLAERLRTARSVEKRIRWLAGVRLWVRVRVLGLEHLAGLRVAVVVPLR